MSYSNSPSYSSSAPGPNPWRLRLYIRGDSGVSSHALQNVRDFCRRFLEDNCDVEVIDIALHPEKAIEDHIIALPTLVRLHPKPIRRIIGDFSKPERVLQALNIYAPA